MVQFTSSGIARLQAQRGNMEACIRCGLCLSVCPTYQETLREEESPRGRIALLKAVAEGAVPLSPDIVQHEENCLICEACTAICPAGFQMEPLQLAFQASLREAKPARRFLLAASLAPLRGRRLLRALTRLVGAAQRAGALALLRLVGLGEVARLVPPLGEGAFTARGQRWPALSGAEGSDQGEAAGQTILFAGCIMSTAFPGVHRAAIEVLTARGYTVVAPASQGCCGALHAHTGLLEEARALARRNIASLEQVPGPIAVDSAGCAAFLKRYGDLLAQDPEYAERARAFASRVRDALELAAARPAPPMGRLDWTVTYQEPCHLAHAQGIHQQPRALLRQLPGLRLVEMAEPDLCCGSAGVYNLLHPEMGERLGRRKAARVRETGAAVVCTANPGCHLQLNAYLKEDGVRVLHVLEVLAEAQRAVEEGTAKTSVPLLSVPLL